MTPLAKNVWVNRNHMSAKNSQVVTEKLGVVKKFGKEFQDFISRGNVVDLAVGVIIGGAFGKIISSLVDDILMPAIGILMGGFDFSDLAITVGTANIKYGNFVQNIIDFLIIAICIFVIIKVINKIHSATKAKTQVEDSKAAKKEDEQLAVLKEIRDHLKNSNFVED
jgi:large conductance mechanosensitive channel